MSDKDQSSQYQSDELLSDNINVDEENESEEKDLVFQFQDESSKKSNQIDLTNYEQCKSLIASYCEQIMKNPEDKQSINQLFTFIEKFDSLPEQNQNAQLQSDIDISLEIILRNCRDDGPLSQLKSVYNYRMDRKYTNLIVKTFQGHQGSYKQLEKYIQSDSNFFVRQKIVYLAYQVLSKKKFKAESSIFFNLFQNTQVTLSKKIVPQVQLKQKKKQKGEKQDKQVQKAAQNELMENQHLFLSTILHICFKVIKEYQNSALLQTSFKLINRFGHYINPDIYKDLLDVIKLLFYSWYNDIFVTNKNKQQNIQSLLNFVGEDANAFINQKVNNQYKLQPEMSQITNYITTHQDAVLASNYQTIFKDFDLTLRILILLTQDTNYDDNVLKSNSILAIYLIVNCYKVNTEERCSQYLKIIKQLLLQINQQQFTYILLRIRKYVKFEAFGTYVSSMAQKHQITLDDD